MLPATPQIIHLFIGLSIIFTIHFGGFTPIFGSTPISSYLPIWGSHQTQPTHRLIQLPNFKPDPTKPTIRWTQPLLDLLQGNILILLPHPEVPLKPERSVRVFRTIITPYPPPTIIIRFVGHVLLLDVVGCFVSFLWYWLFELGVKYLLEDEQTKLNKVSRVFMGLPKNPLLSYVFSILSLYNFINMYVYIYMHNYTHINF